MRNARGRWHRTGQGLRRGILLGLRETAKSIAAGPELAFGSDSRPCRNNAVSRSPSSNHPSSAAARPDATFLWRPSTTSTSQNLKKHPQLHPLPGQCHLPLASLNHIHLSKPQKHPRLHPLPERCHLSLASLNHIHLTKPQKHPQLHPLPERCLLPLASLNHIPLTKPQTYPRLPPMLRADVKKISRTDMRLRHSLSLAFRKKIKCIILIDKRIKTSASVYGKYHTKGGFYHGIQTFWKHDLSSS